MSRKQIHDKYKKTVNMTYKELFNWSKTNASKLASLDRTPIMRNLRLLRKPLSKWRTRDENDAQKTISFIKRMKKVSRGKLVYRNFSKRDIALLNWGYDFRKKT